VAPRISGARKSRVEKLASKDAKSRGSEVAIARKTQEK
jgi:hypothetical protein